MEKSDKISWAVDITHYSEDELGYIEDTETFDSEEEAMEFCGIFNELNVPTDTDSEWRIAEPPRQVRNSQYIT